MFCSKCGTKLDERAMFCSKCGCQVQGYADAEAAKQYGRNSINNLEVNREEILRKLDVILPIYQFIAEKDCVIENLRGEERIQRMRKARNGGMVLLGTLLGVSFTVVMYILLPKTELTGWLMSIALVAPIAFLLIWDNKRKEKAIRRKEREIYETQQEIMQYVKANNIPELYYLPENYRYFIAVKYIRDCIANQRAHNLSDAINLYEEQMHRWKVENYQYHMYIQNLQKRQTINVIVF